MDYTQTCPRCGRDFAGEDRDEVATQVTEHARADHGHSVSHEQVLEHLDDQTSG